MNKEILKKINLIFGYDENKSNLKKEKLEELQKRISDWNLKASKIQSNFDFVLPNYIIDEIIDSQNKQYKNYINLYNLINLAVITGSLSEDNGKIIKQIYC